MINIDSYEDDLTHAGIHVEDSRRLNNGKDVHYEFSNHTDAARALFMLLIGIHVWDDCPNIELYNNIMNINSNEEGSDS